MTCEPRSSVRAHRKHFIPDDEHQTAAPESTRSLRAVAVVVEAVFDATVVTSARSDWTYADTLSNLILDHSFGRAVKQGRKSEHKSRTLQEHDNTTNKGTEPALV